MKNFLRYLPNLIIIVISVVVFFMMSQLLFNFSLTYLKDSAFWIITGILSVLYMLSHWSAYDGRVKNLLGNKEEKARRAAYEADIKTVTNSYEWLDYKGIFITSRNRKKKIEAYQVKIQNKLTKLTNRAFPRSRDIDLLVVTDGEKKSLSPEALTAREEEIRAKKDKCRYIKRKRYLEQQLSTSWLEQNIDKIHIRYNKITEQFVSTGGQIKEIEMDYNSPKGKYVKENLPSRFQNLLIAGAVSAFATDLVVGGLTTQAWFDFGVRCALMLFNIIMGINYGNSYYEEIFIDNLVNRLSITDEFLSWSKTIIIPGGQTSGKIVTATI